MNSLIMLKILRVFDYLSVGNEYWIGNELNLLCLCIEFQFRMYYLKMKRVIFICIERKFVGFFDRFYNRYVFDIIVDVKQIGINKESFYDGKFNIIFISDIFCLFKYG